MTRSHRTILILGVNHRVEVEKGVWENKIKEVTVKAQQEQVYQSRQTAALADGQLIRGRFRVRFRDPENIDYVIWQTKKYKITSINQVLNPHDLIIEIGELS